MSVSDFSGMSYNQIGAILRQGCAFFTSGVIGVQSISAATGAVIFVGHLFWDDHDTHTVDTSGSSAIGWRSGALTFASGSTSFKVGIAPVDTANGPAPRAANTANVIDFDVAAAFTGGGGGITANAWQESVPTVGSKSIPNGSLVAIAFQMVTRGGTDSVQVGIVNNIASAIGRPVVTAYNATTYSAQNVLPSVAVRAADGTRGYLMGGCVYSTANSVTWNSGSATKEYGNIIQVPYLTQAYGFVTTLSAAVNADFDLILYSDPLGTPVAERTLSTDYNTIGATGAVLHQMMFGTPFLLSPGVPYGVVAKPTTANNITLQYKTFGNVAHQASENGGANGYAISRASGAFAAVNSSLDRMSLGLLTGGGGNVLVPGSGLQAISEGLSR